MKITLLASDCLQTTIMYNYLKDDFEIQNVIIEDKVSKYSFIKNRIKRIGFIKTFDQILFITTLNKALSFFSKSRLLAIYHEHGLKIDHISPDKITKVSSVNSEVVVNLIKSYRSDLVLVSGTRIISKKIIEEIAIPMINIHSGITPDYRGVHGAYWALVNNEPDMAGVTVHYIDKGVDTGKIIAQEKIKIKANDNIITYPILQLYTGLNLVKRKMENFLVQNREVEILSKGHSKQWYHPGFFEYLYNLITKNVK
jgi:folate-dependent phosphoribosylglycinamide formyltransferase PurN